MFLNICVFFNKKECYLELIEANIIKIIISLYRYSINNIEIINYYKQHEKENVVYNIVNYIDHNLTSIKNLYDIAEVFSFEYSYISYNFKKIIGCTLNDYFQRKKMEYAKLLIVRDKKTITEVSNILNYSSIHNFSRAFKKYNNVSPQELKNLNIKKFS